MRNALLLTFLASGVISAADPPYAGKWKMNTAKSNLKYFL